MMKLLSCQLFQIAADVHGCDYGSCYLRKEVHFTISKEACKDVIDVATSSTVPTYKGRVAKTRLLNRPHG